MQNWEVHDVTHAKRLATYSGRPLWRVDAFNQLINEHAIAKESVYREK